MVNYGMPIFTALTVMALSFIPWALVDCDQASTPEKQVWCKNTMASYLQFSPPFSSIITFFVMFKNFNGYWLWQDDPKDKEGKKIE